MSDLVPVFIPALSALLLAAEDKKGSALTRDEVIDLRDNATVIMMTRVHAEAMSEQRGYADLDPENCWYDWQMLRRELGREPELDLGARVHFHPGDDPAMREAEATARDSLGAFRTLLHQHGPDVHALIKVRIESPRYTGGVWLLVTADTDQGFELRFFEVPDGVEGHKVGDALSVDDARVTDWMLNLDGALHGGYTLRRHREALTTEEERLRFDEHLGVDRYV